jgi:predicted membrane-bound mannosyltransferase
MRDCHGWNAWHLETGCPAGVTVRRGRKRIAASDDCCWLTFVVLQMMSVHANESVAAVKERWQLAVLRQQETPPAPLKACPPSFRVTA